MKPKFIDIEHDPLPEGYSPIEAISNNKEIVILGTPEDGDDHNCDAMACGQAHVIVRVQLTKPKLKLYNLVQTCFACPSQWDAKDEEGGEIYIRFRFGNLTAQRSIVPGGSPFGDYLYDESVSDGLDGTMSEEEMLSKLNAIKIS